MIIFHWPSYSPCFHSAQFPGLGSQALLLRRNLDLACLKVLLWRLGYLRTLKPFTRSSSRSVESHTVGILFPPLQRVNPTAAAEPNLTGVSAKLEPCWPLNPFYSPLRHCNIFQKDEDVCMCVCGEGGWEECWSMHFFYSFKKNQNSQFLDFSEHQISLIFIGSRTREY